MDNHSTCKRLFLRVHQLCGNLPGENFVTLAGGLGVDQLENGEDPESYFEGVLRDVFINRWHIRVQDDLGVVGEPHELVFEFEVGV